MIKKNLYIPVSYTDSDKTKFGLDKKATPFQILTEITMSTL